MESYNPSADPESFREDSNQLHYKSVSQDQSESIGSIAASEPATDVGLLMKLLGYISISIINVFQVSCQEGLDS